MLRGSNLVLRKQLNSLFSTYFGKKGLFSKILLRSLCFARPVLFPFLFSRLAVALIVAPKSSLAPKPVSEGGPTGPRSELVRIYIHKNIVTCDLTVNFLTLRNFKCYLLSNNLRF